MAAELTDTKNHHFKAGGVRQRETTMSAPFIAAFFLVAMIFAAVLLVAVLMLQQTLSQDSRQTGRH